MWNITRYARERNQAFSDANLTCIVHKGTTEISDPVLVLEGKNHQGSELDVAVTMALLKNSSKRLNLLDARPGSPVLQNLAFLHLRTMREKPLLMEQVSSWNLDMLFT